MVKLGDARLTSQGQISIPKKIRERLHLQKGGKIVFLEDSQGRVVIQEAETPIEFTKEQWAEFLQKSLKEPVRRFRGRRAALKHLDQLMNKPSDH